MQLKLKCRVSFDIVTLWKQEDIIELTELQQRFYNHDFIGPRYLAMLKCQEMYPRKMRCPNDTCLKWIYLTFGRSISWGHFLFCTQTGIFIRSGLRVKVSRSTCIFDE